MLIGLVMPLFHFEAAISQSFNSFLQIERANIRS